MTYEEQLEDLANRLFVIDAVKFGEFLTKSGIKTPVYFDLRVIVSYPDVMDLITSLLFNYAIKDLQYDHVCGVPYTALPIATLLSVKTRKSMLMRRKETKAYGTKKSIEGHYSACQKCLIIEDVITSGSSVLETVKDLRKEGLVVNDAIVILDREQGGKENLITNEVQTKSLFTMSTLIDILHKSGKITQEIVTKVQKYLEETRAPVIDNSPNRLSLPFEKRYDLATNEVAQLLFYVMALKQTNLCLSIDLTKTAEILDLLEKVGEHICMVKTHIDIIEDYNEEFITNLKSLAKRFNFLILEDRKYADIGNTVLLQHTKGLYKVSKWADCVTVHSLPGEGVLKALEKSKSNVGRGVFLLAEMSCEGNLISPEYKDATVNMALKYPKLITGFVCQNKDTFKNPGLIQLTPGVKLESSKDDLGQIYNTPEKVIIENGADIVVVGRGIVAAKNPATEAVLYKEALWRCYKTRITNAKLI